MNEILSCDATESESITEPVLLAEVKAWLKIDGTDDDSIITELITSCREAIEGYTNCSLVSKTVKCQVWLCGQFELPYGPVGEITKVSQGENTITDYSKIVGQFLKIYGLRGCYTFEYSVGYETVPARLKQALLSEIAYRYQNRGDQAKELMIGNDYLCEAALHICQQFKRMAWL